MVRVADVLAEGETWLAKTGSVAGLCGYDIELSSFTQGDNWEKQ